MAADLQAGDRIRLLSDGNKIGMVYIVDAVAAETVTCHIDSLRSPFLRMPRRTDPEWTRTFERTEVERFLTAADHAAELAAMNVGSVRILTSD